MSLDDVRAAPARCFQCLTVATFTMAILLSFASKAESTARPSDDQYRNCIQSSRTQDNAGTRQATKSGAGDGNRTYVGLARNPLKHHVFGFHGHLRVISV